MWGEKKYGQHRYALPSLHRSLPLFSRWEQSQEMPHRFFWSKNSHTRPGDKDPNTESQDHFGKPKTIITEQDTPNPYPAPCSLLPPPTLGTPCHINHPLWVGRGDSFISPTWVARSTLVSWKRNSLSLQDGFYFLSVSPPLISRGAISYLCLLQFNFIFPHFSKDFFF